MTGTAQDLGRSDEQRSPTNMDRIDKTEHVANSVSLSNHLSEAADADMLPTPTSSVGSTPSPSSSSSPNSSAARLTDKELMRVALDEANRGVLLGEGGPFGAVVARRGVIIARAHNRVLQTNDPTAHAEVVAIRDACARLGRFSLDDCVLYASCQPCPMCFAAAHWAKLPRCFFTATADDAARVGFDDRFLYDAIRGQTSEVKCEFVHMDLDSKLEPFRSYETMLGKGQSSLY